MQTMALTILILLLVSQHGQTVNRQEVRLLHVSAEGNPTFAGVPAFVDWVVQWHNAQPPGRRVLPDGYDFRVTHSTNKFPVDGSVGRAASMVITALEDARRSGRPFLGIIGPVFSPVALTTCQVTPFFNAITISYCSGSPLLSDKSLYPLFARTIAPGQAKMGGLVAMLAQMRIERVYGIYERNTLGETIMKWFERQALDAGIHVLSNDPISDRIDSIDFALSGVVKKEARILVISTAGNLTGLTVCRAYRSKQVVPATHLWIDAHYYHYHWWNPNVGYNQMLADNNCDVSTMREAMLGMLSMRKDKTVDDHQSIASGLSAPTDMTLDYFHNASLGLPNVKLGNAKEYGCTVALFDAFTTYGLAVQGLLSQFSALGYVNSSSEPVDIEALQRERPEEFAQTLYQEVLATRTQGLANPIVFDAAGDRRTPVMIEQFNLSATTSTDPVGSFSRVARLPLPDYRIEWIEPLVFGTPDGLPPPDRPPREAERLDPIVVRNVAIGSAGALFVVVLVSALTIRCLVRRSMARAEVARLRWRIGEEELREAVGGAAERRSARSFLSFSSPQRGDVVYDVHDGFPHRVMVRNGDASDEVYLVATVVDAAQRQQIESGVLPPAELSALKTTLALRHDNLCAFLGVYCPAALDDSTALVYIMPSKGSVQELVLSETFDLDWEFRISLIRDLLEGVHCVHRAFDRAHGRLSSAHSCLVDARFVAKIGDYGLWEQYERCPITEKEPMEQMLWYAPELIRAVQAGTILSATLANDVYALGVIMAEIANRAPPYEPNDQTTTTDVSAEQIVLAVAKAQQPLMRPRALSGDATDEAMGELIRSAMEENVDERPRINAMRRTVRALLKLNGWSKSVADNLLKRMQRYADNLEDVVAQRTHELASEKRHSDMLLYEMLPRVVVDRLRRGVAITPEHFQSVSIYFSDIVGFTSLSSESTPMEVIELLNKLYTTFDQTISPFDVYKVETIGDAYMVVSGLPQRNGDEHARQIGLMSLALLSAIQQFRIPHRSEDEHLLLRIGLHSGSVVAGVVGIKMPRYCLFGDTVNTASRMESSGEPLKIHCSESIRDIILGHFRDEFRLDERGLVKVKGKDELRTYWLQATE